MNTNPLHDASPHDTPVPASSQAPALQLPVWPQGGLAAQRSCGSSPERTAEQVPLPFRLQAWQVPQLAVVQQTPSTQLAAVHSWPVAQTAPFAFLAVQVPPAAGQKKPLAQSASVAQVVRQVLVAALQRKPLHDCIGLLQTPAAQVPARVSVDDAAGQEAVEQEVPLGYFWQPPAPSHLPLVPQLAAPWSVQNVAGAAVPAATGAQVPIPFTLQAWQAAQLAEPQQTPSTHAPLMHWVPVVQARPLALSAQFLTAPVPWQVKGARQSVSIAQVVLQALVPHTNGEQEEVVGTAQAPVPLQCETGVKVDPEHDCVPQLTLVAASAHAPAPLQAPVFPHGGLAGHSPCRAAAPEAMLAQVPALPVVLQALQGPQLMVEQQTPSTQKFPVRQSAVAVQACPSRFLLPQRLVVRSQMFGARQSASTVQAALQALVPLHRNGAQEMDVPAA